MILLINYFKIFFLLNHVMIPNHGTASLEKITTCRFQNSLKNWLYHVLSVSIVQVFLNHNF